MTSFDAPANEAEIPSNFDQLTKFQTNIDTFT